MAYHNASHPAFSVEDLHIHKDALQVGPEVDRIAACEPLLDVHWKCACQVLQLLRTLYQETLPIPQNLQFEYE